MAATMTKDEILPKLKVAGTAFASFCSGISDEQFFRQPAEKWSVAQNIKHLITSANMTRLAYRLPKFMVRLYSGKPNRPSRSYEELVAKYQFKLQQGGRASGKFNTKPVPAAQGKENILHNFNTAMSKLAAAIDRHWTDEELDQYLAPHPLLGKLTLRELAYFTIYHTEHHLAIIIHRLKE